jgi:hypothetical protein
MYPESNAHSSQPFAVPKKLNGQHTIPNPSLAADGFNIWWQKTAAQNMAMVTEASDLMRAHRLVSSARQPRTRQAQCVIEDRHARS